MKPFVNILFRFVIVTILISSSACAFGLRSIPCNEPTLDLCIEKSGFNGAVLVAQGGEIALKKGYGFADKERSEINQPDTKFRIGSLTKQFTALAILQLHAAGKLDIDKSIKTYLPDYPRGDEITIHHLLSHTSGIAGLKESDYKALRLQETPVQELVDRVESRPLEFKPGKKFKYSELSGYLLLGHLIEVVSGQTYPEYLQDHILSPLGLANTGYSPTDSTVQALATGYDKPYKKTEFANMSLAYSAGGLYSTVEDLYTLERAFHTEKLVPAPLLEKMFTPNLHEYGYAWIISTRFDRKVTWHNGKVNGFFSFIARFPGDDTVIIALGNTEMRLGPLVKMIEGELIGE